LNRCRRYLLKVNASDLTWMTQPDGSRLAEVTVVAVGYSNRDKEVGQHAAELKQQIEASDVIGRNRRLVLRFRSRCRLVHHGCAL
jgi:hypothetical protein